MGFKHKLLRILVISACLFSIGLAEPTWFVFWAKQPRNEQSIKNVQDLLDKDAAKFESKAAYKPIRANFLKDGPATWYWYVKIEPEKVKEPAYKALLKDDLTDIIDIAQLVKDKKPPNGKTGFPSDKDILKPAASSDIGNVPPAKAFTANNSMAPPEVSTPQRWKGRMKRATFKSQKDAPRQLRFISLPEKAKNDLDANKDYIYDENAGEGARVFVVDSGLNTKSTEWTSEGHRLPPSFLYGGFGNSQEEKDIDPDGHGTCMADLAVGRINGVAKEALLTAVQYDQDTFKANIVTEPEAVLEAMSAVVDNIALRRKSSDPKDKKYVVSMSFIVFDRARASDKTFKDAFFDALKELDNLGVGLVASMPNGEKCEGVPCGYGLNEPERFSFLSNLILVGNGRIDNGEYSSSLKDIDDPKKFTVFAPGDDRKNGGPGKPGIVCAAPTGDGNQPGEDGERGTSPAAALTAGLMAYHMGNGLNRDAARKEMVTSAYNRAKNGPNMIYNAAKK